MNHRPKSRMQNCKSSIRKRENLAEFGFGNEFFNRIPKTWSMEENICKLGLIKTSEK